MKIDAISKAVNFCAVAVKCSEELTILLCRTVVGVTAATQKPAYSATYTTQTTRAVTQATPVKILGATPGATSYSTAYPTQQTQASNHYNPIKVVSPPCFARSDANPLTSLVRKPFIL